MIIRDALFPQILTNVCKIMVAVRSSALTYQEVMSAVAILVATDFMRINISALVRKIQILISIVHSQLLHDKCFPHFKLYFLYPS
jgi:hypothetical protein